MSDIEDSAASSSASAASNTDIHSSGGGSSSNGETSTTGSTNFVRSETEPELVARETKQVRRSKVLFLLLLLIVTVAAGSATYTWAKRDEEQDFEDEFYDVSHEINLASNLNAQHVAEFLNSVSISMTSQAHAQNAVWPNFVASDFEVQGHNFLDSTSADFLIIAPVVTAENRESWEDFSVQNQDWVNNGLEFEGKTLADTTLSPHIHNLVANSSHGNQATYLPFWQASPIPNDIDLINFDSLLQPVINKGFNFVYENNEELLSETVDLSSFGAKFFDFDEVEHPRSLMMAPVQRNVARHHDDDDDDDEVIAVLLTTTRWEIFLRNAIHGGIQGVTLVVSNSCNDIFTYQLNGPDAKFMGFGDLHDSEYDEPHQWIHFEPFTWHTDENNNSTVNCHYRIDVYPSAKMRESFFTNKPAIMTVIVVAVFLFTSLAFMFYDRLVQIRQNKIMDSAQKSNAIVSSLFPAEVRDRLFNKRSKSKKVSRTGHNKAKAIVSVIADGSKVRLKHFLHEDGGHPDVDVDEERHVAEPIADLFPHTTVMFADIAGFTAWSSVREPSQVFKLLETVYHSFDHIAKRRRVFKVETIGDCYVAVTGLPEPREDHAVIMARFARDCLEKMNHVTKKLEESLGPETGDLTMRFGLHSGPVTAGVLRGEKSRFQLFGDTVNTAARMESTGVADRIHLSSKTAEELIAAGKQNWIKRRDECVVAKGKGELQTYWLITKYEQGRRGLSTESKEADTVKTDDSEPLAPEAGRRDGDVSTIPRQNTSRIAEKQAEEIGKETRMVHWISEVLLRQLNLVIAGRPCGNTAGTKEDKAAVRQLEAEMSNRCDSNGDPCAVLDEVLDFVPLPDDVLDEAVVVTNLDKVEIDQDVQDQLKAFVAAIASMYRTNPFHNFEHAGHVTMSVSKLLARIVAPDNPVHEGKVYDPRLSVEDRTYGIASDKLKQFTIVFCGLIHDVDHRGVPNFVLAREDERLNTIYKGQAIAEQNSVEMAWDILMSPDYEKLRDCIYTTTLELRRFRQLIVNTIVATDIFDKDLARHRRERWDRAFSKSAQETKSLEDVSRKASVVIEHIIQASDVAHTMQHWQIYQKFNKRLFIEMAKAYREGRTDKNPSEGWYMAELGFFDNYVIPLAKKLRECGVFGVSSDEYLNYAQQNRMEWSNKGQSIVQAMEQETSRHAIEFD